MQIVSISVEQQVKFSKGAGDFEAPGKPANQLVKLRKSSQQMILPEIRKCSKSDHSMGDNRYSCFRSFGAIFQPLWRKNSHNMAIFHHFLTFLATFLVITTTFMDKTCTERTQTLVTCMVGGTDPFCPSPGAYYGARGVQNMAILGVNTRLLWQACYGGRAAPPSPPHPPQYPPTQKKHIQQIN